MTRLKWNRGASSALIAGAMLYCTGCGDDRLETYPVKGTVIYNGQPLPDGSVTFIPETGPYASGRILLDGTFELTTYEQGDGAIAGPHRVMVSAVTVDPDHPEAKALIPSKYSSEQTSGLTADVKEVELNTVEFELEGTPG